MADLKVFMRADWDLRLIRKIKRSPWYKKSIGETPEDTRRFGGCLPVALKRWSEGQKFGENKWILPTKQYADLVMCCNSWPEFDEGMGKIVEFVNTGKLPNLQVKVCSEENKETLDPQTISIWKQPAFHYGLASGLGISLLGISICWTIWFAKKYYRKIFLAIKN